MKAKKILLGLLSLLCFSAFSVTSCDETGSDSPSMENSSDSTISSEETTSSESVSDSEDSTPSDSSSEEETHIHEWIVDEMILEATCTSRGVTSYKCETCNETKNEVVSAFGHKEVIDEEVKATCETTGLTEGKHCETCNEVLVKQEIIDKVEHNYIEQVLTAATCTSDGVTLFTCSYCNDTKYEVVVAFGHKEVIDEAVKATCETTGLTEGKHCERCDQIIVKQEVISSLSHNYQVSSHKDATCLEDGHTTYVCSNDATHTYTDVHSALGHSYEEIYSYDETYHWQTSLCGHNVVNNYEKHDLIDGYCQKCSYKEEQEHYTDGLVFVYDYDYDYKGYCVYDYTGTNNNVVIPLTYNGLPVTSIGDYAFDNCTSLTSITIPDGVTRIGDRTFRGCSSLESITIPDSVTSIGNEAFYGCSSLTSITIPNSVTSIDWYAFCCCESLTDVTIGNSVTSIGNHAFWGCSSLTSITIPDSVIDIEDYAFAYCGSLTSITIPDSVTSIGDQAFSGCSSLESIVVDSNNANYDSRDNCNAIIETLTNTLVVGCKSTSIPDSVTSIGDYAFAYCGSLTSITIPDSVTSIGNGAFYSCSSLTSITIGNSVTSIGGYAFEYCPLLKEIKIPDSVTSIGDYAFSGCRSLTSITIGNSVTSIGNGAFSGCRSLTSITIPDSVTTIGNNAFWECSSLTSITISDSVTSIGNGAFYGCSSLTSITIPDSITSIGEVAFQRCSSLTNITIPNSVTSIGKGAFLYCSSLTSITIPDSVTSIGNGAFEGCRSLTSITIPNSVTSIGFAAFHKCSSLKNITIPNSVTSIGEHAFSECRSLTSITIPDSVTIIGSYAFSGCSSLTSVTIGKSVTSIGYSAFYGCSSLTDVYYTGTEEQWNNFNFDSSNKNLKNATIHFAEDDTIIEADDIIINDDINVVRHAAGAELYNGTDWANGVWANYMIVDSEGVIAYNAWNVGCGYGLPGGYYANPKYAENNPCVVVGEDGTTKVVVPEGFTGLKFGYGDYLNSLYSALSYGQITHSILDQNVYGSEAKAWNSLANPYIAEDARVMVKNGLLIVNGGTEPVRDPQPSLNEVVPGAISVWDGTVAPVTGDYTIAVDATGKVIYASYGLGNGYGGPADEFYHDGTYAAVPGELCGIFDLDAEFAPWPNVTEDGRNAWGLYTLTVPEGGYILSGNAAAMDDLIFELTGLNVVDYSNNGLFENELEDGILNTKVVKVDTTGEEIAITVGDYVPPVEEVNVTIDTSAATVFTGAEGENVALGDWTVAFNAEGRVIFASRTSDGYGGPGDGFYHDGEYTVVAGQTCGIFALDDEFAGWPNVTEDGRNAWTLYTVVVPEGVTIVTGNEEVMLPIMQAIFGSKLTELAQTYFENTLKDGDMNHVVVNQ